MKDFYYPSYHFRPDKNWMNDPNGLIYNKGIYHMFYQYNPYGDKWGNIHWGHATSRDLIHWEELPIALYPSREEGEIHCYSGCAVIQEDVSYLFYTSIGEGERGPEVGAQQWSAVSYDGMKTWIKYGKPAMSEKINGKQNIRMWRDPFIWKEDCWYAILGGTKNNKGCLILYKSENLQKWEYVNIVYQSEKYDLIECPNMIPLGDNRYLILYSPLDSVRYIIAFMNKENWVLEIEKEGFFDHSVKKQGFYASNTYLNDPKGRNIIIGWLSEADRAALEHIQGWAGMQSVPREVAVDCNGNIMISPIIETKLLRKKMLMDYEKMDLVPVDSEEVVLAESRTVEIKVRLKENRAFEIKFFADDNHNEETRLIYDERKREVILDRSRSSLYESIDKTEISCDLRDIVSENTEIFLHIFLDNSAIEIFVAGKTTISARVYTKMRRSNQIRVPHNMMQEIIELKIWELGL